MDMDIDIGILGRFSSRPHSDISVAAEYAVDELKSVISKVSHSIKSDGESLMQARLRLLRSIGFESEFSIIKKYESLCSPIGAIHCDGFVGSPEKNVRYCAFEAEFSLSGDIEDLEYISMMPSVRTLLSTWVGFANSDFSQEVRVASDCVNPDAIIARAKELGTKCYIVSSMSGLETIKAVDRWLFQLGGSSLIPVNIVRDNFILEKWLRPYNAATLEPC